MIVGVIAVALAVAEASPAAADGGPMLRTESSKMRCFVSASEPQRDRRPAAVCETYATETDGHFPQGPDVEYSPGSSGRANIVSVNDSGELKWDIGDIPGEFPGTPDVVMKYGQTYHMGGWTIAAASDGTRFTYDRTGHGMFVSIQTVDIF
ncbi:MAG: hypothetical protein QOH57_4555 [Mycobacterium sp.]|nr:hypothetical protein [Mycobacterium sp.]